MLPILLVLIGFFTPWGRNFRLTLAETIITTRHYYWAHYITTPEEYAQLVKALHQTPIGTGLPDIHLPWAQPSDNVIEIKPLDGLPDYNGYVMLVHDPHLVRLVAAEVHGGEGEYITHMAKRVGAIAGTNASGFEDPNGSGWGGIPVGLEYIGGRVVSNVKGAYDWTTVGFTKDGVMVMGPYNVQQLRELGVRDAMQFHPELIVNGKPMITYGDGGWGYDPRTAIGQTKDGTVIFVVINGRFRGGSGRGASQRQVMEIMQKYGAINACAMDGGSSSVLYANGKIVNSPSTIDPNGQRHLPDAWMVFPNRQAADAYSP
jgi:exopolysaccharide biosynthesis protein